MGASTQTSKEDLMTRTSVARSGFAQPAPERECERAISVFDADTETGKHGF
jgi:hypothetical protein